jgi:hypothetical protein
MHRVSRKDARFARENSVLASAQSRIYHDLEPGQLDEPIYALEEESRRVAAQAEEAYQEALPAYVEAVEAYYLLRQAYEREVEHSGEADDVLKSKLRDGLKAKDDALASLAAIREEESRQLDALRIQLRRLGSVRATLALRPAVISYLENAPVLLPSAVYRDDSNRPNLVLFYRVPRDFPRLATLTQRGDEDKILILLNEFAQDYLYKVPSRHKPSGGRPRWSEVKAKRRGTRPPSRLPRSTPGYGSAPASLSVKLSELVASTRGEGKAALPTVFWLPTRKGERWLFPAAPKESQAGWKWWLRGSVLSMLPRDYMDASGRKGIPDDVLADVLIEAVARVLSGRDPQILLVDATHPQTEGYGYFLVRGGPGEAGGPEALREEMKEVFEYHPWLRDALDHYHQRYSRPFGPMRDEEDFQEAALQSVAESIAAAGLEAALSTNSDKITSALWRFHELGPFRDNPVAADLYTRIMSEHLCLETIRVMAMVEGSEGPRGEEALILPAELRVCRLDPAGVVEASAETLYDGDSFVLPTPDGRCPRQPRVTFTVLGLPGYVPDSLGASRPGCAAVSANRLPDRQLHFVQYHGTRRGKDGTPLDPQSCPTCRKLDKKNGLLDGTTAKLATDFFRQLSLVVGR